MAAGRRLGAPRGRARWGCRAGFFAVFSSDSPARGACMGRRPAAGSCLARRGKSVQWAPPVSTVYEPERHGARQGRPIDPGRGGRDPAARDSRVLVRGPPRRRAPARPVRELRHAPAGIESWARGAVRRVARRARLARSQDRLGPPRGAGPRRVGLPRAPVPGRRGLRAASPGSPRPRPGLSVQARVRAPAGARALQGRRRPGARRRARRGAGPGRTDGAPGVALRGIGPDRRRGQCDRSCGSRRRDRSCGRRRRDGSRGRGRPCGFCGRRSGRVPPCRRPIGFPGFGRPRSRRRDGPLRLAAPRRRGAPQGPRRGAAPAREPCPLPRFPQDRTRRPPRRAPFGRSRSLAGGAAGQPGHLGREAERRGASGGRPIPAPGDGRSSRRAAPGAHGALVRGARARSRKAERGAGLGVVPLPRTGPPRRPRGVRPPGPGGAAGDVRRPRGSPSPPRRLRADRPPDGPARVLSEVDYCIYCHDRDKDSCSKGLRDKDGAFKKNPLGIALEGCPLDEKISEMPTRSSATATRSARSPWSPWTTRCARARATASATTA